MKPHNSCDSALYLWRDSLADSRRESMQDSRLTPQLWLSHTKTRERSPHIHVSSPSSSSSSVCLFVILFDGMSTAHFCVLCGEALEEAVTNRSELNHLYMYKKKLCCVFLLEIYFSWRITFWPFAAAEALIRPGTSTYSVYMSRCTRRPSAFAAWQLRFHLRSSDHPDRKQTHTHTHTQMECCLFLFWGARAPTDLSQLGC